MQLHDFALGIAAFCSEFLGTLSGFGSSTFFVPTAILFEKFQLVLALTAILHCFGNASKIFLFGQNFEFKIFLRLALPSILFTIVGALLVNYLPIRIFEIGLGLVLVSVSGIFLFCGLEIQKMPTWFAIILSGISGFSTGLVGTGGAIRGIALASLKIEKNSFVALSSAIDFGGDFSRMVIYLKSGFMDWTQWFYLPILAVASFLGAKIGKRYLASINHARFERIVALFIFIAGLLMLFKPSTGV